MEKIISQAEILKKYKDMCDLRNKGLGYDYDYLTCADLESCTDFYKGIDCTECASFTDLNRTGEDFETFVERDVYRDNQVVAFLSELDYYAIVSRDKTIYNHTQLFSPKSAYVKKGEFNRSFIMRQITDEGLYAFKFDLNNVFSSFRFYSNEQISEAVQKAGNFERFSFDEIKFKLSYFPNLADNVLGNTSNNLTFPDVKVTKEDFAMLCNKVYREGLPSIAECE